MDRNKKLLVLGATGLFLFILLIGLLGMLINDLGAKYKAAKLEIQTISSLLRSNEEYLKQKEEQIISLQLSQEKPEVKCSIEDVKELYEREQTLISHYSDSNHEYTNTRKNCKLNIYTYFNSQLPEAA